MFSFKRCFIILSVIISLVAVTYYFNKNSFNNDKIPRSAKLVLHEGNIEVFLGENRLELICIGGTLL